MIVKVNACPSVSLPRMATKYTKYSNVHTSFSLFIWNQYIMWNENKMFSLDIKMKHNRSHLPDLLSRINVEFSTNCLCWWGCERRLLACCCCGNRINSWSFIALDVIINCNNIGRLGSKSYTCNLIGWFGWKCCVLISWFILHWCVSTCWFSWKCCVLSGLFIWEWIMCSSLDEMNAWNVYNRWDWVGNVVIRYVELVGNNEFYSFVCICKTDDWYYSN